MTDTSNWKRSTPRKPIYSIITIHVGNIIQRETHKNWSVTTVVLAWISWYRIYVQNACFIPGPEHPKKTTCRVIRENSGRAQITLHIPRANTLTFQNSFYCRSSRTFNCLPSVLRQSNLSINQFKCNLFNHYQKMSEDIYDIGVPQTFRTICVKCHSCRPLSSLSVKSCC
jgi:hypothetical protein